MAERYGARQCPGAPDDPPSECNGGGPDCTHDAGHSGVARRRGRASARGRRAADRPHDTEPVHCCHAATREAANFAFTISSFAQPLLEDDEVPLPALLSMMTPTVTAGITVVNTEVEGVQPRRWTTDVFRQRLTLMRVSYQRHLEVTSTLLSTLSAANFAGSPSMVLPAYVYIETDDFFMMCLCFTPSCT